MSMQHNYTQTVADGPFTSVVRPSDWNSAHNLTQNLGGNTLGSSRVVGTDITLVGGNNVTLSADTLNSQIIISVPNFGGAQTGISGIGGSNGTITSGTVVFSNSNGVSFGTVPGSGVTASYTVPSTAGLISAINVSAGAAANNLSAITFSNSNNVSFGLAGSTVTASASFPAQSVQPVAVSGSNGSFAFSTLTLGASNGASFYTTNGSIVVSYTVPTVPTQSTQPVALSGSNGSFAFSTATFGNLNGLSFYTSNGSLVASYTVPTQSNDTAGIYASSQTVGQSSSSTYDVRSLSLVGAGIVSAGWSNGSLLVSATTAAQSNQTLAGYLQGNTTGQSSSSTANATSLNISGAGNVSVGWSNSTLVISGAGGGGGATFTAGISGGNTSGNTGTVSNEIVFAGGNNITLSGSTNAAGMTVTISGPNAGGAQTGISSIGNAQTTYTSGAIQFVNSFNVSFSSTTGQGFVASASYSQSTAPGAVQAGTQTATSGTVVFSNSNNVSFGMSNSSVITASASFPAQTVQPVAFSASGGSSAFSTLVFTNSNGVTWTNTGGSIAMSYTVPSTAGLISALAVSGGAGTSTLATGISFLNSNSITFGVSTGAGGAASVTASVSYPVQSAQPVAVSGSNGSFAFSTLTLGALNGASFYTSNGSIVASYTVPTQTAQPVAVSGSNGSFAFSTLTLGNLNGASFYTSNGSVVASYTVPVQTVQPVAVSGSNGSFAYSTLTMGNLNGLSFYTSNGSVVGSYTVPSTAGLLSAINVSAGTTSNNLSAVTFSNSNGVSFGINGSVVTASVAAAGGAQTGISGLQVSNTTYTSGTVTFQNANGISFGSSGAQGISASYTVPSTAGLISAINISGGTTSNNLSALTFSNSNNVSFGLNGSTMTASASFPAQTVQPVAVSGSNGSFAFSTLTMGNLNGISHYTSNGSLVASYTVPTQTVQPAVNAAAGTQTATSGTVVFSNSNGVTFGMSNSSVVTMSYNSTQFAGSGTTFGGTNISGSMTLNSNGLVLSLSGGAGGGGGGVNIAASNTTFTSGTVVMSAQGGALTISSGAQSVLFSVPATSSLVGASGISVSTNGSTISVYQLSSGPFAGTASSFGGTNISGSLTFNTAGLTMSMSVAAPGGGAAITLSDYEPNDLRNTTFTSWGQNTLNFVPMFPQNNFSCSALEMLVSMSGATSSISNAVSQTLSYCMYSQGSGASTSQMLSMASSSLAIIASYSSNLSGGYTISNGANSTTFSSAGTGSTSAWTGQKIVSLPFSSSFSASGNYYLGFANSTASVGNTGALRMSYVAVSGMSNTGWGAMATNGVSVSNASILHEPFGQIYTTTSGAWPATIAFSQMQTQVSNLVPYVWFEA